MEVTNLFCDECGRSKKETNHWHKVVVWKDRTDGFVALVTGPLVSGLEAPGLKAEAHDVCGQECFHKHIAKLMGFTEERQAQNVY